MRKYVVEIQPDCWLAPWSGDPGRTCVIDNARTFDTIGKATNALKRMRAQNPERRLVSARVVAVDVTTTIAPDVEVAS